jgi:succinate dehydrogenase / fumarate reductase flavoprotein subunit
MQQALDRLADLKARARQVSVEGHRQFNPGWHLALDLQNMIAVSECVARAALIRQESRGGHTRDDFPAMSSEWRQRNLVCTLSSDHDGMSDVTVVEKPIPAMRPDLLALFERDELMKYLTDTELNPAGAGNE